MTDLQVILNALAKEREVLHQQLMQIDRIVKRMKEGNYSEDRSEITPIEIQPVKLPVKALSGMGSNTDTVKALVYKIFDVIKQACKLRTIQDEYTKISGNNYNVREAVRSLQKQGLVKMIKHKNANRGSYWVKTEWIEDDRLLEAYKPESFDLFYDPTNITFE